MADAGFLALAEYAADVRDLMGAHGVGSGKDAHPWVDALGEADVRLHDSAVFTPEGRRLLVELGAITPDPLRVAAEEWLASHTGPRTAATEAVRRALGPEWPDEFLQASARFKATPWKGELL